MSTPLGTQELRDADRAVLGRYTGVYSPGAIVDNGTLIPPPGAPVDTHVHYVSEFASFAAAVTALTGVGHQHLIVPTLQTLTGAIDVPDTITIECIGAGGFTSSSVFDLTLKGGFISDPVRRFFGAVNIKFVGADNANTTKLAEIYIELWDDEADDSHDCTAALNSALNAMKTSGRIALRLLARPYRASGIIPTPTNAAFPVVIIGSGDGSSIRTNSASSPALSLDLSVSDPNVTLLFRDFLLNGRGAQSVPVLSLKAQGGTGNRFFGVLDNLKVIGSGVLADCAYLRGGLKLLLNLRTEEGRYALYLDECSNTAYHIHAGNNTCNGVMVKGGGNNSELSARIEDSTVQNTRAVSSISKSGSTVTVVTTTAHGMENMDRVTLSSVTGTNYNFTSPRSITVVNSTTFTYDAVSETGSASGGTVRIATSGLRLKDTVEGEFRNFANEGKTELAYSLWIQSTGTTATGAPSCSRNTFSGCGFAAPADTTRTDLATVLIEGPCMENASLGTTFGKASGINVNSWEFLFTGNVSGVRPRLNRFAGHVYQGTGNSGTIRVSEAIPGAYGNRVQLTEQAGQRSYQSFRVRNITVDTTIDELALGSTIHTNGAAADLTIALFPSYAGMEPILFINDSSHTLSLDPNGTETIDGGAAGVPRAVAAGECILVGCMMTGTLLILASTETGIADGDKGDITVSASGAAWTIDNDVVTYAKMQDVSATNKLLGRATAGAGDVEEIACTQAGRDLIDDADAATQRATLGVVGFLVTGWSTGPGTGTTLYYAPGGSFNIGSGTETQRQTRLSACTIVGIRVHQGGAHGAGGTLIITARKNGSATSMTITIPISAAANSDYDDMAHAFTVADADKVSIEAVNNSSGTGAAHVTITLIYR